MAPAGPLPAQGAPIPQIPRDPWEDGSFNRRLIGCQDLELADGAILGVAKPAGARVRTWAGSDSSPSPGRSPDDGSLIVVLARGLCRPLKIPNYSLLWDGVVDSDGGIVMT